MDFLVKAYFWACVKFACSYCTFVDKGGGRGQKCSNGCHLLKKAQIAHLYRKNLSTKFIIFIILFWILILMEKNLSEKCHSNVVWFEDERSHLQEK